MPPLLQMAARVKAQPFVQCRYRSFFLVSGEQYGYSLQMAARIKAQPFVQCRYRSFFLVSGEQYGYSLQMAARVKAQPLPLHLKFTHSTLILPERMFLR